MITQRISGADESLIDPNCDARGTKFCRQSPCELAIGVAVRNEDAGHIDAVILAPNGGMSRVESLRQMRFGLTALPLSRRVPSGAGGTDPGTYRARGAEAPGQRTARGRLLRRVSRPFNRSSVALHALRYVCK